MSAYGQSAGRLIAAPVGDRERFLNTDPLVGVGLGQKMSPLCSSAAFNHDVRCRWVFFGAPYALAGANSAYARHRRRYVTG